MSFLMRLAGITLVAALGISQANAAETTIAVAANFTDGIVGRVTRKSQEQLGLAAGVDVYAQIKSVSLIASSMHLPPIGSARRSIFRCRLE
jgi:molybdopterin-binding protein